MDHSNTEECTKGLRESHVRLSAVMFDLIVLKEQVSQVLTHVCKSVESVRDRLNEMENEWRMKDDSTI